MNAKQKKKRKKKKRIKEGKKPNEKQYGIIASPFEVTSKRGIDIHMVYVVVLKCQISKSAKF